MTLSKFQLPGINMDSVTNTSVVVRTKLLSLAILSKTIVYVCTYFAMQSCLPEEASPV